MTFKKLSIKPVPFAEKLNQEYINKINELKYLRKILNLSYQDLSVITGISHETLEQVEFYKLTLEKKEITRLVTLLYSLKGESIKKR